MKKRLLLVGMLLAMALSGCTPTSNNPDPKNPAEQPLHLTEEQKKAAMSPSMQSKPPTQGTPKSP